MLDAPLIFPEPQELESREGAFKRPVSLTYRLEKPEFEKAFRFFASEFDCIWCSHTPILKISKSDHTSAEAYHLRIKTSEISLQANQAVGIFRGLHTLSKILKCPDYAQFIPCLEINDFPILPKRGFMIDVSRCKVPTMLALFELINLLAELHFNELQLYVEHTFAFAKHNLVWKDSSPFTGEEIRKIDQYCQDRFIELIPNLNSFGHFERWLKHEPYKHLAECPDGFRREEPFMEKSHGTTLKPNQPSLDFINSLYQEYLPHFSSLQFNVGMDEPWELGQGWSRSEVKRRGKDRVYLDHLDQVRQLVEKHGKQMQFWADVLLEKPGNAKLLPSSASPIIWGYEADHPFEEQAQTISSCGLSYRLAPGTSTWRSFSGRWPNAQANLVAAAASAMKCKAKGILLTNWGDCGNHQPWSILYPPLFLCAQLAWKGSALAQKNLVVSMDKMLFEEEQSGLSSFFIELGLLDQVMNSNIHNASLAWMSLFPSQPEIFLQYLQKNFSIEKINAGIQHLEQIKNKLLVFPHSPKTLVFKKEISAGIELSLVGLIHAKNLLQGRRNPAPITDQIIERYRDVWLIRARPGGLEESLSLLNSAIKRISIRNQN